MSEQFESAAKAYQAILVAQESIFLEVRTEAKSAWESINLKYHDVDDHILTINNILATPEERMIAIKALADIVKMCGLAKPLHE